MTRPNVNRSVAADWATVVIAICAVVVTGFAIRQQLAGAAGRATLEDRDVDNWEEYIAAGRRIGPADAPVTIVEFGDYECPFCKGLEPAMRSVLTEFSDHVALVYRHLPIPYHEHAYQAARLAECAGDQGRFHEAHWRLYDVEDLGSIRPTEFAGSVGVADVAAFVECASDTGTVARIEEDIAAAEKLGITSTPTVMVNALRLARTPDAVRLSELVRSALSEEGEPRPREVNGR